MGLSCLYHVFSESFLGLDTWELFGTLLYIISAFLAKERPGFCSTCWDPCGSVFGWCFSHVFVSFINVLCIPFPFSLLLKLNK